MFPGGGLPRSFGSGSNISLLFSNSFTLPPYIYTPIFDSLNFQSSVHKLLPYFLPWSSVLPFRLTPPPPSPPPRPPPPPPPAPPPPPLSFPFSVPKTHDQTDFCIHEGLQESSRQFNAMKNIVWFFMFVYIKTSKHPNKTPTFISRGIDKAKRNPFIQICALFHSLAFTET